MRLWLLSAAVVGRTLLRLRATPTPILGNSPENIANVLDYRVAQPTPEPVIFDGMYCHGGACQYRTGAPPPTISPTPPVPIIYPQSAREFCQGVSCTPGMGVPQNPALNKFVFNCAHLYTDVGSMKGELGARTLVDAKKSFFGWCAQKFAPELAGNCDGLSDVVVMAMNARVDAANVGGPGEICLDTFNLIANLKQARVDLKLLPGAFPKPPAFVTQAVTLAKVFLPAYLDDTVGPESLRGRAWKAFLMRQGRLDTSVRAEPIAAKPVFAQLDPAFKPDYTQSPPCQAGMTKGAVKYQIDNNVPPTEVDGPLYEFCVNEFSEIMAGFAQTGEMVTTMTKDWCSWQSSVTSWVGDADQTGRPEWDFRRCHNMKMLAAFAVRSHLSTGLTAGAVCNQVFLAFGAAEWHENQVNDAWAVALRSPPKTGLATAIDPAMKKVLEDAQKYANSVYSKMRDQKKMFEGLNGAKMDTAAFSLHATAAKPLPPPLPSDSFPELG